MTYAFSYEVPINADIYARIRTGIGEERAPGLIAHLAYRTEQGLRYVDVWETKDDWRPFSTTACIQSSTRCSRRSLASCLPSPRSPCWISSMPGLPSMDP